MSSNGNKSTSSNDRRFDSDPRLLNLSEALFDENFNEKPEQKAKKGNINVVSRFIYSLASKKVIQSPNESDLEEFSEEDVAVHEFGNHYPEIIEHYSYVPAYPKSHPNGFGTVVELLHMK